MSMMHVHYKDYRIVHLYSTKANGKTLNYLL